LNRSAAAARVVAYAIAWAVFEIPFMPARFVWFRAAAWLPFPFLAAALSMAVGRPRNPRSVDTRYVII